jgi:hypothetical protein
MTVILRRAEPTFGLNVLRPEDVLQTDYVYAWDNGTIEAAARPADIPFTPYAQIQNRRRMILRIDRMLKGFVRWLISLKRSTLYLGSPRLDLVAVEDATPKSKRLFH